MKKCIIGIGVICLMWVMLFVVLQNTPMARMERLCKKAYAQMQEAPAIRVHMNSKEFVNQDSKWKEVENPSSIYWICGENRLRLTEGRGELILDGLRYIRGANDPNWKTDDEQMHVLWDASWDDLLGARRKTSMEETMNGISLRYAAEPTVNCLGEWYVDTMIFHFNRNKNLISIEFETVSYPDRNLEKENISSIHSTVYRITSLDMRVVYQEFESYAQQILALEN